MNRHRLWIERDGVRLAALRWGEANADKPPALLLHGTSFVAETWEEIARGLADHYTVYALDRRGHGASDKPGRYHFVDFARDVCAVIDTLDLSDVYGIGHSAGATDLLLAATLQPRRFRRLFVMEPTIMDPAAYPGDDARLSDQSAASVQGVLRRQREFADAEAAYWRYRTAAAFAPWTDTALRAYIAHGFQQLPDGRVRLRCLPEIEAAMLLPIFEAMEQVYRGDDSGNPFGWISDLRCPVRIATAETSWSVYKDMADRAARLMPDASRMTFEGVGHCVAQEAPALLLHALQDFAAEAG